MTPSLMAARGFCVGCGACAEPGAMRWDEDGHLKPARPRAGARFERICPFSPAAPDEDALAAHLFPDASHRDGLVGRFHSAWVGHVAEGEYRAQGSSGGMVTWVAAELLRRGLVDAVAHVSAADPVDGQGWFRYRLSRSLDEVRGGAKSRYHPVEMSSVLAEIRAVPGRYAIVGIPCFIKAINLLRAEEELLAERIAFTLGLFCGHMKSARMVESFAWQLGVDPADVAALDYRLKNPDRPANWYTAHLVLRDGSTRSKDWWHLADGDWGAGFFQNPACNWCDDVVAETADIAFGDAWIEPHASDGRGTNVVLVRSPELHAMMSEAVAEGRLDLQPADAGFVAQTQAAGLRHRREGLAYRLAIRRGVLPRKRVRPDADALPLRRRAVYRLRLHIATWSNRLFRLARRLGAPALYLRWARAMLAFYGGLAWSHGRIGALADRLERLADAGRPAKVSAPGAPDTGSSG